MTAEMNLAEGTRYSTAVLPTVWKLLRMHWRITWNSFRHARLRAKIGRVFGMLLLAAFGGFLFWVSWLLLSFLTSPDLAQYAGDLTGILEAVPVLILAGLFIGILITSFGVLLQALYLAGDMEFLLSAPIPIRAVFITKLLRAVLPNFGLIALFGLPVLFGLGISRGYNFLYFPLVLVMMISLALAAAGLASVLVIIVVRIFPARRVVEVLGFMGAVISIICSQTGNLMRSGNKGDISEAQVSSALGFLSQLNNPWVPINWPGRGLEALGEGNWLMGFGLTLLSLGLAGGIFWVSLVTAERWYYTGWAGMQNIASRKKQREGKKAAQRMPRSVTTPMRSASTSRLVERWLTRPVRGLIWKDFLVMRRDLRHLSQLVTPLIFGIIYGIMFLRSGGEPPAGQGEAPEWFMDSFRSLLSFGNVLLAIFIGWMLLQRLGGMGFSQEGKNYWMLKAAPVSARQLLVAKYLVAYLPTLVFSTLFVTLVSILQHIEIAQAIYSWLVVALCLAGMAGIQVAFGAAGANFTWEDPRKMNAGNMGCLGMILTAFYIPINLGLFLGPIFLAAVFGMPNGFAYLVGAVLGGGLGLLCASLPPRLLEAKVERLSE
jgi:ABC-2 type transport system permease protein